MRVANRGVKSITPVNSVPVEGLQVRHLIWISVTILGACGPEPEGCVAAERIPPSLQMGTGFEDFVPIRQGDALDIDFGEQGGWHVWMAFRTTGMVVGHGGGLGPPDPEGPTFSSRLIDEAGVEVAYGEHERFPIDGDAEQGELLGIQMRLSEAVNSAISDGGNNPASGSLSLEADVIDACGTAASSQRSVTLDLASANR